MTSTIDMTKSGAADDEPPRKPAEELQPLLVDWLRDRRAFLETTGRALHRGAHRAAWHVLRSPIYLARLLGMSPRGLWRVLRAAHGVLSDGQGHQLRVEAATGSDAATWLKLRKERNERIHRRMVVAATLGAPAALYVLAAVWPLGFGIIAGAAVFLLVGRVVSDFNGLLFAVAAAVGTVWLLPRALPVLPLPSGWVAVLAATLLALGLGWIGRPLGKPLVKPATVLAGNHGPLRAPYVMEALVSLGIKGMTDAEKIGLLFDVARVGPGYQVDLELPRGVAAAAVMEKRSQLSAALRRELGTVWPSVGRRHEGHLVLYVADQPMATAKQAPWPLLKAGAVNVFAPAPMFTDQRGRWVDLTLAYTAGVVGAVPRMGKTFAVRELLLVAGLDPRVKVYSFDLKGTGDLAPTALYAHAYGVGDEDEEIAEQLVHVRALRQEMRRRAKVIRNLSHEECPDNKVTDALANRRELGLAPIVVGVDECQVWFEHPDKAIREEFIAICTDLVKRGPALGIICYFATQKPSAKSIPTDIADNASVRLCFKVNGQVANDQVLGTSSYQGGLRATLFAFEDKGIAYLRGDGADAQIVRTVVGLDAPASEKVAARARAARVAANRLTGHAANEVMEREAEQVVLLDDVREVFREVPAMHLVDIVDGLAQLRPTLYGHLDAAALGAQLRTAGVETGSVYVAGKGKEAGSGKGVKRTALDVTATAELGGGDPGEGNVRQLRPGSAV